MSEPEHQQLFESLALDEPAQFAGHLVLRKRFGGDEFLPEECTLISFNSAFAPGAVSIDLTPDPEVPLATMNFLVQANDENNALENIMGSIFDSLNCTPEIEPDELELVHATIVSEKELSFAQSKEPDEDLVATSPRYYSPDAFVAFDALRKKAMGLI